MATLAETIVSAVDAETLRNLTNVTGAAEAVNSTILGHAISMTNGRFRVESGIAPDPDDELHLQALIPGVIYNLHVLKGVASELMREWRNAFIYGCKAIREKATISITTSSTLAPRAERVGNRPDLDRDGFVSGLTDGTGRGRGRPLNFSPTFDGDV